MHKLLTRMLALITFAAYLTVGTVVVRFYFASQTELNISLNSFKKFTARPVYRITDVKIANPVITFSEIKESTVSVKHIKKKVSKVTGDQASSKIELVKTSKDYVIKNITLPFKEVIEVSKVSVMQELPVNLAASFKPFGVVEKSLIAEKTIQPQIETDEVKTQLASTKEVDPQFFDYQDASKTGPIEPAQEVIKTDINNKGLVEAGSIDSFDYSKLKAEAQATKTEIKSEEVNLNDLVSFNHVKADQDARNIGPQVSLTTQNAKKMIAKQVVTKAEDQEQNAFMSSQNNYPVEMNIQVTGIDFNSIESVHGFEIRFQDSLQGIEDYGSGEVEFRANLAQPKMTRSIVVLKRGYAPTNTDLILEAGTTKTSIPLIDEAKLNEMNQSQGVEGITGSVIVELDDETELAQLDIPFKTVIKLNGEFRPTEKSDYRYLAFLGVKVGNALLTYVRADGLKVNKIIHIHENEITFDANYYEQVINEKFQLFEDDLLAKDKSPLIISSESVKIFARNETAKKINDNTYKLNFDIQQLGGRKYIELNHQDEPVFVGFRENNQLDIPSENFMRHILSRFENAKLGNRCLVQINLNKKTQNFEVATESVNSSLTTYHQILERDGKFYDSLSDKSEKIIIVGENQSSDEYSQDGKINIRIDFTDGSEQYLSSYCSPNTYLVEQL